MFTLGAVGFIHELFWQPGERPWLLYLSGALMGLPVVMSADRIGRVQFVKDQELDDDRWSHLP